MEPVLIALAFHRVTEVHWSLSGGTDNLIACDFATGAVQGYPDERLALLKRQKVDDNPVVPVLEPAVGVNWLLGVTRRAISDVAREYRQKREVVDDGGDLPADFLAEAVDDLDDIFVQEALWKTGGGSFFTAGDRPVLATALVWLSNKVQISGSELVDGVHGLANDVKASHAGSSKAKKEVEWQKGLVSIAQKSASSAPNSVVSLGERIAVSGTRKAELFPIAASASDQIARTTV